MVTLYTSRLLLTPHVAELDAEGIATVMGDAVVMQHIGAGALSYDAVVDYLSRYAASWAEIGMGGWTIRRAEDQSIIGNIFMKPVRDLPPEVEVGYTLGRAHWRQGFASEALSRVIRHAREDRELERVVALVRPENLRSSALLLRNGFALEQVLDLRAKQLELYVIRP